MVLLANRSSVKVRSTSFYIEKTINRLCTRVWDAVFSGGEHRVGGSNLGPAGQQLCSMVVSAFGGLVHFWFVVLLVVFLWPSVNFSSPSDVHCLLLKLFLAFIFCPQLAPTVFEVFEK